MNAADAALNTVRSMGYTYHGGEYWKPPLGPKPEFTAQGMLSLQKQATNRFRRLMLNQEIINDEIRGDLTIDAGAMLPGKIWQMRPREVDPGCHFYVSVDPAMGPNEMTIATFKRGPQGYFVMDIVRCKNIGLEDNCGAWFEVEATPPPPDCDAWFKIERPAVRSNVLTVAPLLQRGPFGLIS